MPLNVNTTPGIVRYESGTRRTEVVTEVLSGKQYRTSTGNSRRWLRFTVVCPPASWSSISTFISNLLSNGYETITDAENNTWSVYANEYPAVTYTPGGIRTITFDLIEKL